MTGYRGTDVKPTANQKGRSGDRGHALVVSGFTLIELMVVVAVVAILAAVAYPNYLEQVRKSRRAQAKADMVEYMQLAERRFTVENTYVGYDVPEQSPREGGTAYYGLEATTQTATDLVITATPQGTQADDSCGTLSLASTGAKDSDGELSDCW
jgi:prepilin-type N-terminal cleavage/methylation domain-containing protein